MLDFKRVGEKKSINDDTQTALISKQLRNDIFFGNYLIKLRRSCNPGSS